jgi:LuxR family maltose regulon positive regulatory protein
MFVIEGPPMAALLRMCVDREIFPAYASRLLALGTSPIEAASRDAVSAPSHQPLVEPLTDREVQILRLLTTHLTSTEIAEELYLSVNTVRTHIKHVYQKLDAHSRAEAVAQGQALDLI